VASTRRIREIELLGDVLDGDQALEFEGVVDHQQTLQLVLVQQRLRFFGGGAIGHSDQALARRHDLAHRLVVAGLEAQVAPGGRCRPPCRRRRPGNPDTPSCSDKAMTSRTEVVGVITTGSRSRPLS
jgi:hypothetical protein